MANRVLIFSPWWHESREIQAFCRAWRIGQEKTCYLKRFIMRDSVEEHMLNVQRIKQADINAVMTGAEVSEEEPQIRTTIKYLFGIGYKGPIKQKKNLKRMASSDDD
jgi:SNF2 family DNA or RNA helicase